MNKNLTEKNKDYLDGIDIIYWINLDRAKDRQHHMNKIFKDNIFKNKKIIRNKAIDYKDKNLTNKFTTTAIRMKEPEYACLLSHLETIRKFSKTNYETALILEDDIDLDYKKYWTKSLKEIIDGAPKDWDIIKIYINIHHNYDKPYTLWDKNLTYGYDTKNELSNNADWGMQSYIINNKAAKKITNKLYHNKKYVLDDSIPLHFADYLIYKLLKTYVYKYPYFKYRNNNTSYIQLYNCKQNKTKKKHNKTDQLIIKREKMLKNHKNKTLKIKH